MIPLRLTVKNFMCYRDGVPTLDLEGIHLACLCGDNGHGKTALLDAITWALWGQARSRSQEELVHQGQQDMAVELEFMARGQRHRVSRRHARSARSRQGASILELQVASDNGFRPITGGSMRETEAKIREILHMDYETFINTAFLRQGDADRFTTSRPAERQERLAEVLDLSYYRGLEDRAKARSRDAQDAARSVTTKIELQQKEIAFRPEYQQQLTAVKDSLEWMTPEVDSQRLKVQELRRTVDSLQARRTDIEDLVRRLARDQTELSHLEGQQRGQVGRVGEYQAALQDESEIREGFTRLETSRSELERLNQALARKGDLDRERAQLDREIAVQGERYSGQATQLRKRIDQELEPATKRLPEVEDGLNALSQDRGNLAELEAEARRSRQDTEEISASVRDLELANERLRQEMEDTRKKFNMLEQGDNLCPLCQQPLGAEGQEHLRREYEEQGYQSKEEFQRNSERRGDFDKSYKAASERLEAMEKEVGQKRQRLEQTAALLARDKAECQRAQIELQKVSDELLQVESLIALKDFAQEERKMVSGLESKLASLGYDEGAHSRVQAETRTLDPYDALHRKLLEAVDGLPAEREAMETTGQMLARRRQEVSDAETRNALWDEELKALPSKESELEKADAQLRKLDHQKQDSMVRQGVLEQQIDRCNVLESGLRGQEQELRRVLDEKSVYDELGAAFGKNGIQALIIETAIPQLENDANELLGRLTESRMSLKLQLQEGRRDSRTGQPSEELDIRIGDEVGTRSYETFSGGEAFRINFALRIALSKLLAQRSGAPLPILFIDEGFGSQDSAGQERLIEAIRSIEDDFQKIIVITHIEGIKDSFPVRIEVTKTGNGSTFELQ